MKQHPRVLRVPAGRFQPMLDSWKLSLQASGLSTRTVDLYTDVGTLFGGWLTANARDVDDWDQVRREQLRPFFVWLQAGGTPCRHELDPKREAPARCDGYGRAYVNNIGRGLQQFFGWYAEEEDLPNVMTGFRIPAAPKLGEIMVPIIEDEHLIAILRDAEGKRDYSSRRDAALLRLFLSTGTRLAELTGLQLEDINLERREAIVTGKGRKQRTVRFDGRAALALDRYLRLRRKRVDASDGKMTAAAAAAVWIGERRFIPMTESGIRQVIQRRGTALGLRLHPHMFRHTFSHRWLDKGGAEGDLMELNGWDSPQMLKHYGRTARGARARRAYDRVDVMEGI